MRWAFLLIACLVSASTALADGIQVPVAPSGQYQLTIASPSDTIDFTGSLPQVAPGWWVAEETFPDSGNLALTARLEAIAFPASSQLDCFIQLVNWSDPTSEADQMSGLAHLDVGFTLDHDSVFRINAADTFIFPTEASNLSDHLTTTLFLSGPGGLHLTPTAGSTLFLKQGDYQIQTSINLDPMAQQSFSATVSFQASIVPLPSAFWSGLALLAGVVGLATLCRRPQP